MANLQLSKLKKASEVKGKIKEWFSDNDLIEMAKNHSLPHYILHNPITKTDTYCFITDEINEWFANTHINQVSCKVEQNLTVLHFNYNDHLISVDDIIPKELSLIKGLYKLPLEIMNTPPGIYFLCHNKEIVYVGQSESVGLRISAHLTARVKEFDEVYFIPCHISNLNRFELAMIRHLRPKYNTNPYKPPSEDDLTIYRAFCNGTEQKKVV